MQQLSKMKYKLNELTRRAEALDERVKKWESKLTHVMEQYEAAQVKEDSLEIESYEREIKSLLKVADKEKAEMLEIEDEINKAAAEEAFKGNFSLNLKRKKDG
jgi:hypothetical protein|tara:strand:- start:82 stop:390 length:309 start_codon:yes stop_codon:yes gene_type:complete